MTKRIYTLLLLFLSIGLFGQVVDKNKFKLKQKAALYENNQYSFKTADGYIKALYHEFGLESENDLKATRVFENNNWKRHRYTQTYKDIEVLGTAYILHEQNNAIVKSSGDLLPLIDLEIVPKKSEQQTIVAIKDYIFHKALNDGKNILPRDINVASIALKIIDQAIPKFSGQYALVYEVHAGYHTKTEHHFAQYLIDANTGDVYNEINKVHSCAVPGKAVTHYYGEQDIEAQFVPATEDTEEHYALFDASRNIATVDNDQRNNSSPFGYETFSDDDNFWDNFNENRDELAGDAHYCATAYHDFMDSKFGWDGLDGEGGLMVTVVHAVRKFFVNAFWNGTNVQIGNGDCVDYGPLTTLTIIGHEYAHAFTEFSSGLIYQDESGALNESISDILGKAIEYEYDRDNFTWEIGDKILMNDDLPPIRSMSDPNSVGDPAYYRGQNWWTSAGDNGGVHTNSGVYNHWCYLLVEGVTGTNEIGIDFSVPALGWEVVADIVYGSQVSYFTPSTRYTGAYLGTLAYTADVYGENSAEYAAVEEAWRAVGVSDSFSFVQVQGDLVNNDFISTVCLNDCLPIETQLFNTGFDNILAGTEIFMQFEIDNTVIDQESFVLQSDFEVGDTLMYTFQEEICHDDPSEVGSQDHIEVFVSIGNPDDFVEIDQFFLNYQTNLGFDLILSEIEIEPVVCVPGLYSGRVFVDISGCESLPANTPMSLKFTDENGNQFVKDFENFSEIVPNRSRSDFISFEIEWPLERTMPYTAELILAEDPFLSNNLVTGVFQSFEVMREDVVETFDDYSLFDSEYIFVDPGFFSFVEPVNYQNENYMAIGSLRASDFALACENPQDVYYNYSDTFKSFIEICFDASTMEEPVLRFDVIPFYSNKVDGLQADITNMIQVLMPGDDDELVEAFTGMPAGELTSFEVPVTSVDGTIRIAVVNRVGSETDFIAGLYGESDLTFFDNIRIEDRLSTSIDEVISDEQVQVFPNPALDLVNFKFDTEMDQISISTIDGRRIDNQSINGLNFGWNVPPNVKGLFFFEAKSKFGEKYVGKFLIQ